MHKGVKKSFVFLGIAFLAILLGNDVFAADTYKIDPTHSTFGFAVSHVKVGVVRGEFTDYSGEVQFDRENFDQFRARVVVKTESINTRLWARDNHLRGADFFDAENYPTITFEAKKLLKKGDGYEITGELTMKGVTREVSGPASVLGPVKSPFGGEVIGIHGETVIDRRDFGISWNNTMPDGGFVVGNDVRIIIDIEADRK